MKHTSFIEIHSVQALLFLSQNANSGNLRNASNNWLSQGSDFPPNCFFCVYQGVYNHLKASPKPIFNRPGLAWAVLQPPLSLIEWVGDPFVQIPSKHLHSQTVRARELQKIKKFHQTGPVYFEFDLVDQNTLCITFEML